MKNQADLGHGAPVTRRDFIARGLMAGGGLLFAPSLFRMCLTTAARADAPKLTPFITLDLNGGAALPGNFLVGKAGGAQDLLASYSTLGWDPRQTKIDTRFGAPMADASVSQILAGILGASTPEAQANFRMGTYLHAGLIDTSANPLSAVSLVLKSGLTGKKINKALGTRASPSGGNSRFALEGTQYRPLSIQKIEDLTGALNLSNAYAGVSPASQRKIADALRSLSVGQLRKVTGADEAALVQRFDDKHAELAAVIGQPLPDPRKDPVLAKIYGITSGTPAKDQNVIRAGIVGATLTGIAGPSVIMIDGCDYHNNTQTDGDAKDLEIGKEIGRIIEAAKQLNTPVFIHIITDGGIYAADGTRMWKGDSTEACMSVIGYYDPKGPRSFYKSRQQIGAYNDAQGADRGTIVGDSTLIASYAAFANYLQIDGRLGDFEALGGGAAIARDKVEQILLFEG
jgi:hypothetical protein